MINLGQADLPKQMLRHSSTLSWQHSCQHAGLLELEQNRQFILSETLRNMIDHYEARVYQVVDMGGDYINK